MRRILSLVVALAAATGLSGPVLAKEEAPKDPFVVHEWGTFTSVQGADGVGLEGLEHEEEALPSFVYSRSKVRDCPLRTVGWKGLEVPAEHVTQKMETPVLYFHTSTPRRVRVRVDFVGGLITQWYPVSDLLGPPEGPCDGKALDVSKVERSFLQWDVDLVPRDQPKPSQIPTVASDDPWALARRVDAAYVRTLPRKGPERQGPVEAEHYLFYRGLGAFSMPFRAQWRADGTATFENGSDHQAAQVVAIEVTEGGAQGRYDIECYVQGKTTAQDLLKDREMRPWATEIGSLQSDVAKILRGQGMAEDEAEAMVATWSRSWFTTEGTRFLYVVPRPLVDALLPLRIDPAPDAIARVLVGRIEVLSPAAAREVVDALRVLGRAARGALDDAPTIGRAKKRLARLGRFQEAHLRGILAGKVDADVRAAAKELLPAGAVAESAEK